MHKKFVINRKKIKGGCQSGKKVVAHDSSLQVVFNCNDEHLIITKVCNFSNYCTAQSNLCLIYLKLTWAIATLSVHMHKKFEVNRTKIKGRVSIRNKSCRLDFKQKYLLSNKKKLTFTL